MVELGATVAFGGRVGATVGTGDVLFPDDGAGVSEEFVGAIVGVTSFFFFSKADTDSRRSNTSKNGLIKITAIVYHLACDSKALELAI